MSDIKDLIVQVEHLEAQVSDLKTQMESITILTPWQIKVVVWTSQVATGLGTIIIAAMAFTGVLTAWQKIEEWLQ